MDAYLHIIKFHSFFFKLYSIGSFSIYTCLPYHFEFFSLSSLDNCMLYVFYFKGTREYITVFNFRHIFILCAGRVVFEMCQSIFYSDWL